MCTLATPPVFGLHKAALKVATTQAASATATTATSFGKQQIKSISDLKAFVGHMVVYTANVSTDYFTHKDNYTFDEAIGTWYGLVHAHEVHQSVVELLPVLQKSLSVLEARTIPLSNDLIDKSSLAMRRATAEEIARVVAVIKKKQAQIPAATWAQYEAVDALINPSQEKVEGGAGAAADKS